MSELLFYGLGATSPSGLDSRQSAMNARAAKFSPRAYDPGADPRNRIGTARVRRLPDDLYGTERMLALATTALTETVFSLGIPLDEPVPIFVALPEKRCWAAAEEERLNGPWLEELAHRARFRIDRGKSQILRIGHAGFAAALEHARAYGQRVIVGGVDSYHHPDVLQELVESFRLLSETAHAGLVPSEAAAFFLLGPTGKGTSTRAPRPFGKVGAVACGLELPKTWEEPRVAELLTDLVFQVAQTLDSRPLEWVLNDNNGERQRAKERDYLAFRAREWIGERTVEMRLAREMGDVGAASGAMLANQVLQGFRTGFAPARQALVMTSSHGDARGVFAMEAVDDAGA